MEKAKGPRRAACTETIRKQQNRCVWVEIVNLGECRKKLAGVVSILKQPCTFITISKLDLKNPGCSAARYSKMNTDFKTCARGWGDGTWLR